MKGKSNSLVVQPLKSCVSEGLKIFGNINVKIMNLVLSTVLFVLLKVATLAFQMAFTGRKT